MEPYPDGGSKTRASLPQQGLTLGYQWLFSHRYNDDEDAHPKNESCGRIPLRFEVAWLQLAVRSWTARILDWKKLHCLTRPILLGVSTPTWRPRDADAEVGDQKPTDAKIGGQRPADAEVEGQRSEVQRDPESKSGGLWLSGSGTEL